MIVVLFRSLLLLLGLVGLFAPVAVAGTRAKSSLDDWTKVKSAKVVTPAKPTTTSAPKPVKQPAKQPARTIAVKTTGRASVKPLPKAGKKAKAVAVADAPAVSGKVVVFGFKGDGGALVHQEVVSTLRTRGLNVETGIRPVDSAEQYREMAATLNLAAYIDGAVSGDGPQGRATVNLRSGVTGRRIASVRFSGERSGLAADVGSELWNRAGSKLTRLCVEAAKPRKRGRGPMRIDAGTPIEDTPREPEAAADRAPKRKADRSADPWADEGT
jgi:hypothetical protein